MSKLRAITPVSNLGWFDHTDIRIETTIHIAASPTQVFDCLAEHRRWTEWFTSITAVTRIGTP